jgi:hypothetical protein
MPERQRQLDAAVLHGELPAATEIEAALPNMQIGMTDAGGLDGDHNLIAGWFGIEHIGAAKRVAELDDLVAPHSHLLP